MKKTKLARTRLLLLDVDGILTDGRIFYVEVPGQGGQWTRQFHMRDGYGIKRLLRAGIQVAVMSGSDSKDIRARMEGLGVSQLLLGDEDKLKSLERMREMTGIAPAEMAYMGDDLYDLPVLEKVGFSATVPEAPAAVRAAADYVTRVPGGWGAVREVADLILASRERKR